MDEMGHTDPGLCHSHRPPVDAPGRGRQEALRALVEGESVPTEAIAASQPVAQPGSQLADIGRRGRKRDQILVLLPARRPPKPPENGFPMPIKPSGRSRTRTWDLFLIREAL